jgi:hypothetical protein
MTLDQAIAKARTLASLREWTTYYVVSDPDGEYGPYDVCDDVDLDTFYHGTRDSRIVFCTADD